MMKNLIYISSVMVNKEKISIYANSTFLNKKWQKELLILIYMKFVSLREKTKTHCMIYEVNVR